MIRFKYDTSMHTQLLILLSINNVWVKREHYEQQDEKKHGKSPLQLIIRVNKFTQSI